MPSEGAGEAVKFLEFLVRGWDKKSVRIEAVLAPSVDEGGRLNLRVDFQTIFQNFNLFKNIIKKMGGLKELTTTQKSFLIKMGIKERAEILSRNLPFSKKADIFYRLKRLIDETQMGDLFKIMFIKNKKNKFNLGFGND